MDGVDPCCHFRQLPQHLGRTRLFSEATTSTTCTGFLDPADRRDMGLIFLSYLATFLFVLK
ncbi:MAG: hypothetical protein ACYSWX_06040, partial [Planctomycetota bacterium]